VGDGQVLDPTLTWQGYGPGGSSLITVKASDLFDCDGSKGINALILDDSATWCDGCQGEAQDLSTLTAQGGDFGAKGVQVLTLMCQDANSDAATSQTALDWRNTYNEVDDYVLADPNEIYKNEVGEALPKNVLIDPRTMKRVNAWLGWDPSVQTAADALAATNKK
jgi:hypothetical protein